MAERNRRHIVVPTPPTAEPFTIPSSGGGADKPRYTGNRLTHGQRLAQELDAALAEGDIDTEHEGTYVTFVSSPELELAIESLDVQASGDNPELVAVREVHTPDGLIVEATVFIPDGKKEYFQKKLDAYVKSASDDRTRNAKLIDGIQTIKRATIRQLWTDPDEQFPSDPAAHHWWEVWLRKRDGNERQRLTRFSAALGLRTSNHFLGFGDRTVVLLRASTDQLAQLFGSIDDIAELRRPHEIANFLPELYASEQKEWVDDILNRVQVASEEAPVVCILDRGVQAGHPLLSQSIAVEDLHAADSAWTHDPVVWHHGTEMAGLALYGDVLAAIATAKVIRLRHRLESVKILPDHGSNDPELYGAVTARAIDQPEISSQRRRRVYMLAVTATTGDPEELSTRATIESGKPTSWSASIDALTYGRAIDDSSAKFTYLDREKPRTPRLFILSAGNIRDVRAEDDHLDRSDAEAVEDPAQAWNALTVGAYTEHDDMAGAPSDFAGYIPIAQRGELSPASRTSVSFERTRWPFKPEVVASGGNHARTPSGAETDTPPNLAVLTTRFQRLGQGFFTTTRDTSAATAQVAALAADIYAAYPEFRPETVRALVVHSARWTDVMQERFDPRASKSDLVRMLRRYGMGVPSLERALYSATDALTLISEASLRPYEREGNSNDGRTREMNLHQLPWPIEQLRDLGDAIVTLRVTLSYFVEPNPSSRGWTGRYIYPSHGLRFATKRPEDGLDAFRQRNNTRARPDGRRPIKLDTEKGWLFGSDQQRAPGSLHTDIWTGSAEDLANKGSVVIYPVGGWWKNRGLLDQSDQGVDYSLIISIESPNVEVDLWTPVYQQVHTTTEIAI